MNRVFEATKLIEAVPLLGSGRLLGRNEQEFISRLVDLNPVDSIPKAAIDLGMFQGGTITITVRFADGREAGVRLVPK